MWQILKYQCGSNKQELLVVVAFKEVAHFTCATNSADFSSQFFELIKQLPKLNNIPADTYYHIKQCGTQQLELWKKTAKGELAYKMFTAKYEAE
jgi:hypothetical protein